MANYEKLDRIHRFIDALSKVPELKAQVSEEEFKILYQMLLKESDIVETPIT